LVHNAVFCGNPPIVAFMHHNSLETDVMREHKNISKKVEAGRGDYVERFELD
jgi:hypothetical protein